MVSDWEKKRVICSLDEVRAMLKIIGPELGLPTLTHKKKPSAALKVPLRRSMVWFNQHREQEFNRVVERLSEHYAIYSHFWLMQGSWLTLWCPWGTTIPELYGGLRSHLYINSKRVSVNWQKLREVEWALDGEHG